MHFLIENEEFILRNVHEADKFVPDSFEVVKLGMEVSLIVGVPTEGESEAL